MPEQNELVRGENGPGCWIFGPVKDEPNSCQFTFIHDTKLKLLAFNDYVSKKILPRVSTGFMQALRKHARTL